MNRTTIALLALLVIAMGIGMRAAFLAPDPEPVEKRETTSETVAVETPPSCLAALNSAEDLISMSGDSMVLALDITAAQIDMDLAALTIATDDLTALTAEFTAEMDVYFDAAEDCRAKEDSD